MFRGNILARVERLEVTFGERMGPPEIWLSPEPGQFRRYPDGPILDELPQPPPGVRQIVLVREDAEEHAPEAEEQGVTP